MAISRSVTEGNHRKQSQNNSRALEARSENNLKCHWCQTPMAIRQAVLHEKEITLPEKKAGGLKAISRSVTKGNHRKQSQK